jgi:hypothetical protein
MYEKVSSHLFFLDLVELMTRRCGDEICSRLTKKTSETHMNRVNERKRHIKVWRLSLHTYTTPFGRCLHKPKDSLNNLSPLVLFLLPMFSLALFLFRSCIYNWWAKAQILNIRRDDSWKEASAKEKRREERNGRTTI